VIFSFGGFKAPVKRAPSQEARDVPLANLATHQVRTLLNAKQNSGLSGRTVQCLHAVLRKALNVAVNAVEAKEN